MDRLDPDSDYQYDATNQPAALWTPTRDALDDFAAEHEDQECSRCHDAPAIAAAPLPLCGQCFDDAARIAYEREEGR